MNEMEDLEKLFVTEDTVITIQVDKSHENDIVKVKPKKVECLLCHNEYWRITNTHLWATHRTTMEEYQKNFPDALIEDEILSIEKQNHKRGHTYEEIHGAEKALELIETRRNDALEQMKDAQQIEIRKETCGYEHSDEQKKRSSESHIVNGNYVFRKKAIEKYGEECQRCGSTENIIVHHIDGSGTGVNIWVNNDIENLMVLCKSCHMKLHTGEKRSRFIGIGKVEKGVQYILTGLKEEFGLDIMNEHFKDTPKRVARAYYEMCCGINSDKEIEEILKTSFPSEYKGIVVCQDIKCYSMCPHHLLPIEYRVNIGYIPNGKVLGISKLPRIVELLAKAPKIQEDFTSDIIKALKQIDVLGAIVHVHGKHDCMCVRGVEMDDSWTVTSELSGLFEKPETREEFQLLLSMGGKMKT